MVQVTVELDESQPLIGVVVTELRDFEIVRIGTSVYLKQLLTICAYQSGSFPATFSSEVFMNDVIPFPLKFAVIERVG